MSSRRPLVPITLLTIALVVALLVSARSWFDPQTREIRRIQERVDSLAKALSFSEKGSIFTKAGYAEKVAGYFAEPTELRIAFGRWAVDEPVSRHQIFEGAAGLRASAKGLAVEFIDIAVSLSPVSSNATAHLTSKIYFTGDPDYWVQEFRLALAKTNQEWFIREVVTVKTMEQ